MYGMYRWPLCMIVQIKPCGFVDPTWRSCCAYVTPTWRNGEENIRGKLPVYGHMFNSFCGPNSLLPYLELHSRLYCSLKCMKAKLQKRKL